MLAGYMPNRFIRLIAGFLVGALLVPDRSAVASLPCSYTVAHADVFSSQALEPFSRFIFHPELFKRAALSMVQRVMAGRESTPELSRHPWSLIYAWTGHPILGLLGTGVEISAMLWARSWEELWRIPAILSVLLLTVPYASWHRRLTMIRSGNRGSKSPAWGFGVAYVLWLIFPHWRMGFVVPVAHAIYDFLEIWPAFPGILRFFIATFKTPLAFERKLPLYFRDVMEAIQCGDTESAKWFQNNVRDSIQLLPLELRNNPFWHAYTLIFDEDGRTRLTGIQTLPSQPQRAFRLLQEIMQQDVQASVREAAGAALQPSASLSGGIRVTEWMVNLFDPTGRTNERWRMPKHAGIFDEYGQQQGVVHFFYDSQCQLRDLHVEWKDEAQSLETIISLGENRALHFSWVPNGAPRLWVTTADQRTWLFSRFELSVQTQNGLPHLSYVRISYVVHSDGHIIPTLESPDLKSLFMFASSLGNTSSPTFMFFKGEKVEPGTVGNGALWVVDASSFATYRTRWAKEVYQTIVNAVESSSAVQNKIIGIHIAGSFNPKEFDKSMAGWRTYTVNAIANVLAQNIGQVELRKIDSSQEHILGETSPPWWPFPSSPSSSPTQQLKQAA